MTTNIIRTTIAALFVATSFGVAGTAGAGMEHRDTDKASYATKAVPAAKVVERGPGRAPSNVGEKVNRNDRGTEAFAGTGIKGTHIATMVGEKQSHRQ